MSVATTSEVTTVETQAPNFEVLKGLSESTQRYIVQQLSGLRMNLTSSNGHRLEVYVGEYLFNLISDTEGYNIVNRTDSLYQIFDWMMSNWASIESVLPQPYSASVLVLLLNYVSDHQSVIHYGEVDKNMSGSTLKSGIIHRHMSQLTRIFRTSLIVIEQLEETANEDERGATDVITNFLENEPWAKDIFIDTNSVVNKTEDRLNHIVTESNYSHRAVINNINTIVNEMLFELREQDYKYIMLAVSDIAAWIFVNYDVVKAKSKLDYGNTRIVTNLFAGTKRYLDQNALDVLLINWGHLGGQPFIDELNVVVNILRDQSGPKSAPVSVPFDDAYEVYDQNFRVARELGLITSVGEAGESWETLEKEISGLKISKLLQNLESGLKYSGKDPRVAYSYIGKTFNRLQNVVTADINTVLNKVFAELSRLVLTYGLKHEEVQSAIVAAMNETTEFAVLTLDKLEDWMASEGKASREQERFAMNDLPWLERRFGQQETRVYSDSKDGKVTMRVSDDRKSVTVNLERYHDDFPVDNVARTATYEIENFYEGAINHIYGEIVGWEGETIHAFDNLESQRRMVQEYIDQTIAAIEKDTKFLGWITVARKYVADETWRAFDFFVSRFLPESSEPKKYFDSVLYVSELYSEVVDQQIDGDNMRITLSNGCQITMPLDLAVELVYTELKDGPYKGKDVFGAEDWQGILASYPIVLSKGDVYLDTRRRKQSEILNLPEA